MQATNVLVYLVRHDLRVADNPILDRLASSTDHGFTHLLPVYVLPPYQIEVSGFLKDGEKSPFPEAKGELSGFWRCGPHRARFIAQAIWNFKDNLKALENDLIIRIGQPQEVLNNIVEGLKQHQKNVGAVWMIAEEGYEEQREEKNMAEACSNLGIDLQLWVDEKYFIDDRDVKPEGAQDLPDVFTTYRKMNEPLRERPRPTVPRPAAGSLPKTVESSEMPSQAHPFEIPPSLEAFETALVAPIESAVPKVVAVEPGTSAHPFRGGEDSALQRLRYLIKSGNASSYKTSRNGLLGMDYSTKLSAHLAQGSITARQVHEELLHFENGTDQQYAETEGFGEGENEGTKAIRFELLWRDYMRLCTRKFKAKLFYRSGFRNYHSHKWKMGSKVGETTGEQATPTDEVSTTMKRVFEGTTGQSLIDASSRELIHTGYTSNRARQNVGSFFAKHLNIDWRYGAEWYEFMLVDYDVNSNWSNWQYVAGVGNDPRGENRIFNPVKQAFDYDKDGDYVRCWVPELRKIEKLENLFQPWTTPKEDWERFELAGLSMAEDPVKKIEFSVEGKPKSARRPFARRRGQGRNNSNGTPGSKPTPPPQEPNSNVNNSNKEPPSAPRAYQMSNQSNNPRGPRGGGRGYRGGYRGRAYSNGPRGGPQEGPQGGRGGWQQPFMNNPPPHPWSHLGPA
ncbi:cryptochrome [Astrocystis sublimbata]|nr:cryptochrome [Astrocystis sublimbata]